MVESNSISIEVACAWSDRQVVCSLQVPEGTTVRQALRLSELARELTARGVDVEDVPLGVFGRRVGDDCALRDGDRVEVYRRLRLEPRAARRLRSAVQRQSRR